MIFLTFSHQAGGKRPEKALRFGIMSNIGTQPQQSFNQVPTFNSNIIYFGLFPNFSSCWSGDLLSLQA